MSRFFGLIALAGCAACGYTFGAAATQEKAGDGRLPRVAVMPFDNDTFRRGLEIRLTRLVDDELRARSPRSPRDPSEADWLLRGTIEAAEERVLSEDRRDRVRESSFLVRVRVTVVKRATNEPLWTYSFVEVEPFSARAGRIRSLEEAREEVLRDLAERIVYGLEARTLEKTT